MQGATEGMAAEVDRQIKITIQNVLYCVERQGKAMEAAVCATQPPHSMDVNANARRRRAHMLPVS